MLLVAHEDAPGLCARDVPAFLRHLLERTDFSRDLHFLTRSTSDTLDYTGCGLHEGSKLIWASAGEKRRELGLELRGAPDLPEGFSEPRVAGPGLLVVRGPAHSLERGEPDPRMEELARRLEAWPEREAFPLGGRGGRCRFLRRRAGQFSLGGLHPFGPGHGQLRRACPDTRQALVLRLRPWFWTPASSPSMPPLWKRIRRHARSGSAGRAGWPFAWIFLRKH